MRLLCAFVLAAVGAILVHSSYAPDYKTIEVSPGVFEERWPTKAEFWSGLGTGSILLILSFGLLWRLGRSRWQMRL
jgi:hypothetical protein